MKLDNKVVLREFGQCTRCRQCRLVCEIPIATTLRPICPTGEYFKWDTYFASGRVSLAKKILLEKIEYDETILQSVYTCTLCGSCLQQCPILKFNPLNAVLILRQIAVERGMADKYYRMPDVTPIEIACENSVESDTGLFVGTVAQSDAETVKHIADALTKADVGFQAISGLDAGEYLLRKCDYGAFETLRGKNIKALKSVGIKKLIVHDPLTYRTFAGQDYKLSDEGIDVVFYLSLLNGKLQKKVDSVKAMLHDNSSLGRYMGLYELPRDILTSLGYELQEPLRSKQNAMSCGAYPDNLPEVADLASEFVLADAEEVGVEELITVGRNDAMQLAATATRLGSTVKVEDISNLL